MDNNNKNSNKLEHKVQEIKPYCDNPDEWDYASDETDDDDIERELSEEVQTGIIYMATSPSGKQYIGQHNTNRLDKRKKSHITGFHTSVRKRNALIANGETTAKLQGCTALYNAFEKYGADNFTWVVLKDDVPLKDLNMEENDSIDEYNTMSPNGYNLIRNKEFGVAQVVSDETRERLSLGMKKSIKARFESGQIAKAKELDGMPMHINFYKKDSKGAQGYIIEDHPNISYKCFTSQTIPLEELKRRTLEFYNEFANKKYDKSKFVSTQLNSKGLPKGVHINRKQYVTAVMFKKKRYGSPRFNVPIDAYNWAVNKKKELGILTI